MQDKPRLPTRSQLTQVRNLLHLFGPAAVARLTGVPLRDVFRIGRTLPVDRPFPNPKKRLVEPAK